LQELARIAIEDVLPVHAADAAAVKLVETNLQLTIVLSIEIESIMDAVSRNIAAVFAECFATD
jgi:hypothetical protein